MKQKTFKLLKPQGLKISQKQDASILETIPNLWQENRYTVKLDCHEFTCLCPVTGHPDFARLIIEYCPDKFLIESKSLKFYLFSFRNKGIFHEFIINKIGSELFKILSPFWLEIRGEFQSRGGISIIPSLRLER